MSRLRHRLLEQGDNGSQICVICCCTTFSVVFIVTFIMSLFWSIPNCSMQQFEVFALSKNANSTSTHNTMINYDLKLNLRGPQKGVYYDALNFAFYYKPNLTSSISIGNITYSAFYQKDVEITHFAGYFDASESRVNWENARDDVVAKGLAVFRVNLDTSVRYKLTLWKTKRHRYVVGADLHVNDEGKLIKKKKNEGIKLTSGTANYKKNYYSLYLLAFLGLTLALIL